MLSHTEIIRVKQEVKSIYGTVTTDVEIEVTTIKTPNDKLNELMELTKPFYKLGQDHGGTPVTYCRSVSFMGSKYEFVTNDDFYYIYDGDSERLFAYDVDPVVAMEYIHYGFFCKGVKFQHENFTVTLRRDSIMYGNGSTIMVYDGDKLVLYFHDTKFQYSVPVDTYINKVKAAISETSGDFSNSNFGLAFHRSNVKSARS
jgi:hypothetical protein